MASNSVTEKQSKHIDIRYHYIQEIVADGKINLYFIEANDNPTDMFTKNLSHIKFNKFRAQLGLSFYK